MWGSMCRGLWLQCQWQVRQACHTRQRGCRGADLTHHSTSVVLIEHTVSLKRSSLSLPEAGLTVD